MATFAGAHVSLYRDLYRDAGVDPAAISSWADVARLPVVDKTAVRDGYPDRSLADDADLSRCLISTSSGSTGRMMVIPHRADRFWPYLLSSQRFLRWAAGGSYPPRWRQAYVYTSEYPLLKVPGFYPLKFIPTAASPDAILDALEAFKPQILATYPSVLRDLVAVGTDRMRALMLRGVSVGSELSTQEERDGWEAALGCPVRDEYSSEELGRIASQCPEKRYHLHEDIVHTEILDAEGQPTDGIGEVVGTEFHNRTMPFVRYRQGDLARISLDFCPCGRKGRLLVDLAGRANDAFILADGRTLAPGFLLDVCYRALIDAGETAVTAYRFVQRTPTSADFEVVPGPGFGPALSESMRASLERELKGCGLTIRVVAVDALERAAGGKRATVFREIA
jgi:phenylacetate-CoA ligase